MSVYVSVCVSAHSKSSLQYDKDFVFFIPQLSSVLWVDNSWYIVEDH